MASLPEISDEENEMENLERRLIDESVKPIPLSYAFLKSVTSDFSQVIGSGGFGVVYMGNFRNVKVAVKMLFRTDEFSEKQFEDEVICLTRAKHKNIVKLLGYCSDTSRKLVNYSGRYVVADLRRRYLCFEYIPNNLHDYLKDESHGNKWDICYQLIEEICQGLQYLHDEEKINHLDLKPENILLDVDMVPKITDFGLSRRYSGEQSRIITEHIRGTLGYLAPEYLNHGEISFKSDIYSLGIMIRKLIRGSNDLSDFDDWQKSLDSEDPQMKRCLEIAQLCVDWDQRKRPTIGRIVDILREKKDVIQMVPHFSGNSTYNSGSSLDQHSNDGFINLGSTSILNVGSPSVADQESGPVNSQSQGAVYNLKLYMHQTIDGPNHNQLNIADPKHPQLFGFTNVHDYPIYDSHGPNAKIIARAQGLHAKTSMDDDDWFHWSSIIFTNGRFWGSSFKAIGNQNKVKGEWAIVAGTGVFTFEQGTLSIRRVEYSGLSNTKEICISAFCSPPLGSPNDIEHFKDGLINIGSNASLDFGHHSIDNLESSPSTAQSQETYHFHLYMHQTIDGPNHNQVNIANLNHHHMFGYTNVHDYPIYDSHDSSAKIVAHAQGLHTKTSMDDDDDWFHWSSVVFITERFWGSSFMAIGNQTKVEGNWAIVGGTGVFAFAQGSISIRRIEYHGSSNVKEICIRAFCSNREANTFESEHFKDGIITRDSDVTSNSGLPTYNPQSGPSTPALQGDLQYDLKLYMHQTIDGPNHNQVNIANPNHPRGFGYTNVHDYPIYDSHVPNAKIVARAQGLHTKTSLNDDDWLHWSSILFINKRFWGSSFKAIGNQNKLEGSWAIAGGTGVFTFAQGTIFIRRMEDSGSSNIKEIHIRALCRKP